MKIMNNNSTRASSLDALRGYAILTMVLSGSVAWGVLPGWMYHAQVGPRSNFVFDGSIYGITWVDLVFPFFLFAMGKRQPMGGILMALPLESALSVGFVSSIPSRKLASAIFEVGPKILFSHAFSLSAHAIIRRAMSLTSGT